MESDTCALDSFIASLVQPTSQPLMNEWSTRLMESGGAFTRCQQVWNVATKSCFRDKFVVRKVSNTGNGRFRWRRRRFGCHSFRTRPRTVSLGESNSRWSQDRENSWSSTSPKLISTANGSRSGEWRRRDKKTTTGNWAKLQPLLCVDRRASECMSSRNDPFDRVDEQSVRPTCACEKTIVWIVLFAAVDPPTQRVQRSTVGERCFWGLRFQLCLCVWVMVGWCVSEQKSCRTNKSPHKRTHEPAECKRESRTVFTLANSSCKFTV